jgi:hypothetical protein
MVICESCRKECNDFYHEQTDNSVLDNYPLYEEDNEPYD